VNSKFRMFSCSLLLASALTLACAGGAKAGSIKSGQFVTHTQGDWGAGGSAASLLSADYGSVYAGTSGELIVGSQESHASMLWRSRAPRPHSIICQQLARPDPLRQTWLTLRPRHLALSAGTLWHLH
jgi:hypothetical protein